MRVLIVSTAVALLTLAAAPVAHANPPTGNTVSAWQTWLDQQEGAGGHTEACHVNVATSGLIHRIESPGTVTANCRQANAASSFTNKAIAATALTKIRANITQACSGANGDTHVQADAGTKIGQVVTRFPGRDQSKNRSPCGSNKAYTCTNTNKFFAIIRKNGDDCFLLTAFPQ